MQLLEQKRTRARQWLRDNALLATILVMEHVFLFLWWGFST